MRTYAYRKIRNHWVVYRIKEQTWVKWFRNEIEAYIWTKFHNEEGER